MSEETNIPNSWFDWDGGFNVQIDNAAVDTQPYYPLAIYQPPIDFVARAKADSIKRLGMVVLTKKEIAAQQAEIEAKKLETAIQLNPDIIPPHILNQLRPFQIAGVLYAVSKGKCFLADEMGLGKTIEAIAATVTLKAFPTLVVCPASLKYNWKKEIEKWSPDSKIYMFN